MDMLEKFNLQGFEHTFDKVIRKGEEPEWNINEELKEAICGSMPKKISIEEQAIYVYCKMLEQFSYDIGYYYKEYMEYFGERIYSPEFSKEYLENLKPGSKVTCWDFSRVFAKIVNDEIKGDIEAVIISTGMNQGHFLAGFYTDRAVVTLEPMSIVRVPLSDITRAEAGIKLEGIAVVSDTEGIIPKAIEEVYALVNNKPQMSFIEYIDKLRELPKPVPPNQIGIKLQAFAETMKENGISELGVSQLLKTYLTAKFWSIELEISYLGRFRDEPEFEKGKGNTVANRVIAIRRPEEETIYLLDTSSLELETITLQELNNRIGKEFIYEDKDHRIAGLERGEDE